MRQTWDEQAEQQREYLKHIGHDSYTPYQEMVKWRRRFWAVAAIAAVALAMVVMLILGDSR